MQRPRGGRRLQPDQREALADTLVRVSQLVIDFPEIASLTVGDTATLALRPPGETSPLAIAPYPAELTEAWDLRGETLTIRPIRPEDAAAHAALFSG